MPYKRQFETSLTTQMQRIGFIVYPGFHLLSLSALSVFEFANLAKGKPVYAVELLSVTGGPVHGPMGLTVDTKQLGSDSYDTIMVSGGSLVLPPPELAEGLRDAPARYRRVVSTCTGAFALAEAGLLGGGGAPRHTGFMPASLPRAFPT
jgi:transcriptional regulator GlxA family with amidase domain